MSTVGRLGAGWVTSVQRLNDQNARGKSSKHAHYVRRRCRRSSIGGATCPANSLFAWTSLQSLTPRPSVTGCGFESALDVKSDSPLVSRLVHGAMRDKRPSRSTTV